ncbi:MAG TPA: type II secretion system protein [Fimbriimonadaceae bacterium]|nr:type II secretion system protein [Fimbriimonadaceae bacterium]
MKAGFTLIELLVVIAIISILAAILFPVFAQAKSMAKATAAMSNVRQIGMATALYATDCDDTLPLAVYASGASYTAWNDMLDPYVKSSQIWYCPGSKVSPTDANGKPTTHWGYNARYMTNLAPDFSNVFAEHSVTFSAIGSPSETVLYVSAMASVPGSWCGDDGKYLLPPSGAAADCWGRPDEVLLQSSVLAWADSHANRKRNATFYDGQSPPDRYFDLQ